MLARKAVRTALTRRMPSTEVSYCFLKHWLTCFALILYEFCALKVFLGMFKTRLTSGFRVISTLREPIREYRFLH